MPTEYVMRAFKTSIPTGHVYWASIGSPDLTGTQSGYNPADLTGIAIDYTTITPVPGNPTTPAGLAGGDLGATYPNPTVIGLQTRAISATAPSDGYVLTWVALNNDWEPQPGGGGGGSPSGPAGGDLGGTYPNPTVINLTGSTGVTTVSSGTTLNFGTNPSTTGLINAPNAGVFLAARDVGGSGQLALLSTDTANELILGASNTFTNAVTQTIIAAVNDVQIVNSGVTTIGFSRLSGDNTIYFTADTLPALLMCKAPVSDAATSSLTIQAQSAFASASVNVNGGNLILTGGTPASGGVTGQIQLGAVVNILAAPPSAPPSSGYYLYIDTADNNALKTMGANGTVMTIGRP